MKLCIECKHYRPLKKRLLFFSWVDKDAAFLSRCAHPSLVSKTTGEPEQFAELLREFPGDCGPEGKLWEQK